MAGLTLAYIIQHTGNYEGFINFSIYEKKYAYPVALAYTDSLNVSTAQTWEVTWFENSFPGVAW